MNDILVWVFLRGGLDGLNLVVPQFDPDYYRARPTIAIPESKPGDNNTALPLDGQFGLHPAFSPLKTAWDAGHLAFIHACGSPDPSHSHFECQDLLERGIPVEKSAASGWISRHLQTTSSTSSGSFRAVSISSATPASLRGEAPTLAFQSLAGFKIQGIPGAANRFEKSLTSLYELNSQLKMAAQTTLAAVKTIEKAGSQTYSPKPGITYPQNNFAAGLKQVAQLIKAGVGLEVAALDLGGFDTHVNEGGATGQLARVLGDLGGGLSAFYQDTLDQNSDVTIIVVSEFGRRVQENGNSGTDHGHGNVMLAIGKNTNGGKVFTKWPGLKKDQLYGPGDLSVAIDFRDVLSELVRKRLANSQNLEQIFPKYQAVDWNIFK